MFITKLTDSIIEITADAKQIVLFELDQRKLVKWMQENRPDIIRDIVCENLYGARMTTGALPWDLIASDIDNAIRMHCKGDYLHSKNLARKVLEDYYRSEKFPNLVSNHPSLKATTARITMSCRKRKWVEWSGNGVKKGSSGTKVFVISKEVRRCQN